MAIGFLQSYEQTCEVQTIRRLVNEALASAKPVASFESDAVSTPDRSARAVLAALLGQSSITDEQLTALYWLTWKPVTLPIDENSAALLTTILGDVNLHLPTPASKAGYDAFAATDLGKAVKAALAPLVSGSGQTFNQKVAVLQRTALASPNPQAAASASQNAASAAGKAQTASTEVQKSTKSLANSKSTTEKNAAVNPAAASAVDAARSAADAANAAAAVAIKAGSTAPNTTSASAAINAAIDAKSAAHAANDAATAVSQETDATSKLEKANVAAKAAVDAASAAKGAASAAAAVKAPVVPNFFSAQRQVFGGGFSKGIMVQVPNDK